MAFLRVMNGQNPGQQFELVRPVSIMGRHPECEIVLDVAAVSRQHAQIIKSGEDYFVEDLKSRNGTFVNNELIHGRHQLHDQDFLKICDLQFCFFEQPPAVGSTKATLAMPESSVLVVDDNELTASSTIMSKLDVSSSGSGLRVTVNPEVKLRAMMEITRNLATSLELDQVLPKILDSLFKIFVQADRGFLVLRETDNGPLIPKAVKQRHEQDDGTIRISRTVVNQAMTTREALLSADAATDSRFQMSESIADFRIRSMMCAPLINSAGRALGVIQIDTLDQRAKFQQDDLDVLASVAAQAAIAVENAQLHETAMKQRAMERDLALAHKVQQGLLPSSAPKIAGYEFFDFYLPANQVGGDYFDYVPLPDDRLGVIVADVSGKGIPAALLMAKVSAEARFCLAMERSPAAAISRLNASFAASGWEDRFVTLVLAVLDFRNHQVTLVNAGHMAPYLRHCNGKVESIGEELAGVPLGVTSDFEYEEFTMPLQPGDCLTQFTDGISEAMNVAGDLYGLDKVRSLLELDIPDVREIGNNLLADVKKFVGSRSQSDDMCLIWFGRAAQ